MNLYTRMIVVLTVVGLISGGFLSVVGMLTQERIELNRQKEIEEAIGQVVPGTKSYTTAVEEKDLTVYEVKGEQDNLIGYAVYARGTGFQDIITLMFGTDLDLDKINSLTILEQKETPGLGAKITDGQTFLQFWEDREINQGLTLRKPAVDTKEKLASSEVNTITGATISSQKVLDIVNFSLEQVRSLKNQGKLEGEE
jgi:Na+-translocating ferredoxin:NAD+ oxidoreductase subunit G